MKKTLTLKISILVSFFILNNNTLISQVFSENFSDSLSTDWEIRQEDGNVITETSNWKHTFEGPTGSTPTSPLISTTNLNGWMIFDSDLDCTGNTQDAWLISPPIDCSLLDTVVVNFESFYRSFNDRISIQVSTDGLENWKEYPVHPNIIAGDFGGQTDGSENPTEVFINVSDTAAFKPNVRFAFRFHSEAGVTGNGGQGNFGCAYNWQVDDFKVFDSDPTPKFDIKAQRNFFAISPSAVTPASQVVSLGFLCDIRNVGLEEVTGANVNITIKDSGGTILHTDSLGFDIIQPNELIENQPFNNTWTPEKIIETYTGNYNISIIENDERLENNEIPFQFITSDSVFSKDLGVSDVGFSPTNAINTNVWTAANHYYVPNGSGFLCSSVLFGIANAPSVEGSTINIYLYEWENVNGDFVINPNERNGLSGGRIVGNTSYTIQADDKDVIVVLDDWDNSPENKVRLKDSTHYILAVETASSNPGIPVQIINGRQDYGAMTYVHTLLEAPRYGSFSNRDKIGSNIPYFIENFSARIRMHIQEDPTYTISKLSPIHKVNLYPIPTADILNINLDFKKSMDMVNLKVIDLSGKTFFEKQIKEVKKEQIKMNVSDFPQGAYFLHIETPEGLKTELFNISR